MTNFAGSIKEVFPCNLSNALKRKTNKLFKAQTSNPRLWKEKSSFAVKGIFNCGKKLKCALERSEKITRILPLVYGSKH